MKKEFTLLFLLFLTAFTQVFGQKEANLYTPEPSAAIYEGMEIAADLVGKIKPSTPTTIDPNRPEAMFDVQFILRPNDSLGAGIAKRSYGVLWTGTEFWMSQWTSDSIARFNQTGKLLGYLKVANLPATTGNTGIRGLCKEGANIWATNTSNFIMRLDPTTGQILESITAPPVIAGVRFATWDPTDGTGGFWVGTFGSDLYKISKTGAIIRTIPRSTHGLLNMAGAAYDDVSVGGPYLWVNCQSDFAGTGNNSSFIRQVDLASGIGTSIVREMKTDVPALNANFSGGATIATLPGFTKPSLIMVAQNTTVNSGVVIGYELNFVRPNVVDMSLDSLDVANGFSVMPLRHKNPVALRMKVRNIGFSQTTNAAALTELYKNNNLEVESVTQTPLPALSGQLFVTPNLYLPTVTGNYTAYGFASATGDANRLNDTAVLYFAVSDSTYATDQVDAPNLSFTALSIGGTVALPGQKRLGMTYSLPIASTINSVTIRFQPTLADDSVQIKIYKIVNGIPSDSINSSPIYVTTTGDVSTSTIKTLRLRTPLNVAANESFVICLVEGRGSMRVASTTKGYRPKTMWAFGTFWINTDTFTNPNFRAALYLRPNINLRTGTTDVNSNISQVKVYPNPTSDALTVSVQLQEKDKTTIALYDVAGHLLLEDKTVDNQNFTKQYPLSNLPSGMYILKVTTAKGTWQEKVFKE
jgi:Secretion system C-terminal sorting domain